MDKQRTLGTASFQAQNRLKPFGTCHLLKLRHLAPVELHPWLLPGLGASLRIVRPLGLKSHLSSLKSLLGFASAFMCFLVLSRIADSVAECKLRAHEWTSCFRIASHGAHSPLA